MARTELTRTFPVEMKTSWDYLNDPHHWQEWFVNLISVENPDVRWSEPGDSVRFSYRLLGRTITGECIIDEREEPTRIAYTARMAGFPDVHHRWDHTDLGGVISTTVVLETDEPTSFFGKTIDRTLIPRALARDLRRTLDNLEDIFGHGLHEE